MSTALVPLPESQSRSEVVASTIKGAILSRKIRPGDTLVERRIADELRVSKTPVREALIMLQQSGLVRTLPNRRLAVASLSLEDVMHIYQERALLEPWAVQHARPDDRTVQRAEIALSRASAARNEGNEAEAVLANRDFHRAVYSTCANPFIIRSLDELQDLTALAVATVVWKEWGNAELEAEEHRRILQAVAAGNLNEAGVLMGKHIRTSNHPDVKSSFSSNKNNNKNQ